jgi:hypothetical protein
VVERLPLSDARVRDELAAAAERRLHSRAGREQRLAGVAAFLAASPLGWIGGWPLGMLAWFAAGFAGATLLWQIVARCPGTALHVFRERQREMLRSTTKRGPTPPPQITSALPSPSRSTSSRKVDAGT